ELREPRRKRPGRDRAERVEELVEPDGALVGDVEHREGVAALEEVRRPADLPRDRSASTTAHAAGRARAPRQAPRRSTAPGGTSLPRGRPPEGRRGRRGCARG